MDPEAVLVSRFERVTQMDSNGFLESQPNRWQKLAGGSTATTSSLPAPAIGKKFHLHQGTITLDASSPPFSLCSMLWAAVYSQL